MVPGLHHALNLIREAFPRLVAVYLYGSWASGQANDRSDCDLAVLTQGVVERRLLWGLNARLAEALGREVDLVDLRNVSSVLAIQVVTKGQAVLDQLPRERGEFEDFVFSSYARLNEERAEILSAVLERGSIHG